MHREGLIEAKKCFGTFENLAKALGVKPQRLNNWLNYKNQMPIRYAVKLIELTKGKIPFNALVPYLDPEDTVLGKWLVAAEQAHHLTHTHKTNVLVSDLTAPIKELPISERVKLGEQLKQKLNRKRGRPGKKNVQHSAQFSTTLKLETGKRTRELIAQKLGFGSHFSYHQAKTVMAHGIPALIELMDSRAISLSTAALIAALPSQTQHDLVQQGVKALNAAAKKIMVERRAAY